MTHTALVVDLRSVASVPIKLAVLACAGLLNRASPTAYPITEDSDLKWDLNATQTNVSASASRRARRACRCAAH